MKIVLKVALGLALLAAAVAAFVLFQGYRELHRPHAAWQGTRWSWSCPGAWPRPPCSSASARPGS